MTTPLTSINVAAMSIHPEAPRSKFHTLLQDQIRHEFNAEHQYIAIAVWFDNHDLPQLAKRFYAQSVEERNHAMMIVQYFVDRDIAVDISGIEPIELALTQEKTVTDQIVQLASTAREEGDYLGEQFMQWFLKEQVEEVAHMTTLLNIADRAGSNLFDLEEFMWRELSTPKDASGAPSVAGGSV
jgi:ferritin